MPGTFELSPQAHQVPDAMLPMWSHVGQHASCQFTCSRQLFTGAPPLLTRYVPCRPIAMGQRHRPIATRWLGPVACALSAACALSWGSSAAAWPVQRAASALAADDEAVAFGGGLREMPRAVRGGRRLQWVCSCF